MWQLEELERQVSRQTLAATLARTMGSAVDIPDPEQVRADFDAALRAAPRRVSPREMVLRKALGLRSR